MTPAECSRCGGRGWIIARNDGVETATRCTCRGIAQSVEDLHLPDRLQFWQLSNFSNFDNDSLKEAINIAKNYIKDFLGVDYGLLFSGPCGVGKSHLAVGVLRAIADTTGIKGTFVDYSELLYRFQRTIGHGDETTMEGVMAPLIHSPLLLIDDFASSQGNAWVLDMVYYLVNQRYLARRHILVTTRFEVRLELAKRVGAPLVSRLQEMCKIVNMEGEDQRPESRQPSY